MYIQDEHITGKTGDSGGFRSCGSEQNSKIRPTYTTGQHFCKVRLYTSFLY
jgi:hypothetical protein